MIETELSIIRRAFPEAQRLLGGPAVRVVAASLDVGWHDTAVNPESGAAAVVRRNGPYESLVGEVLRVESERGSAFVYVVNRADVTQDISLARRGFMAISPLSEESVSCTVELV